MWRAYIAAVACAVAVLAADAALPAARTPATPSTAVAAVEDMIARVLGGHMVSAFDLSVTTGGGADAFTISPVPAHSAASVLISATSTSALSAGVGWYLKYYCNVELTWGDDGTGDQLQLPQPLPSPTAALTQTSPVDYRYTWNVCTFGYSMAFWDVARWERELDLIALQGVNLPLAFWGQEYLWAKVYTELGLTEQELQEHFAGPAFLPWERMGNMRGLGGPLTPDFRERRFNEAKFILARMRELGMTPVLPCFAGHVPKALATHFPKANITRSPDWAHFPDQHCCDYLLMPNDPLFAIIGSKFVSVLQEELGTDHWYQCDTFNEMAPASTDTAYLKTAGSAVIDAIQKTDPNGKWLMQGWLFHENFWTSDPSRVEAYLSGVRDEDMLILDLNADASPTYSMYDSFFGKPFVWNMLLNYGGRGGIYGDLPGISSTPLQVAANASVTMTGIGITPEAIENNPVAFELMLEMGWRSEAFSLTEWLANYTHRRYGCSTSGSGCPTAVEAWNVLAQSVYGGNGAASDIAVSMWQMWPGPGIGTNTAPNATAVLEAARLLLSAGSNELQNSTYPGPFLYDLTDVTTQALSNLFADYFAMLVSEYKRCLLDGADTSANVRTIGNAMLRLIQDADALLGSNTNFLLGRWTGRARRMASTPAEVLQYEFNARNQVTLWGRTGEINDYAAKWWAGLLGEYYHTRWSMFIDQAVACMAPGAPSGCNSTTFPGSYTDAITAFEEGWSNQTTVFPEQPSGDEMAVAAGLHDRYFKGNAAAYEMLPSTDAPFNDLLNTTFSGLQTWTRDVATLQTLCDANPSCVGFNNNGYLKLDVSHTVSEQGATLWVKKQTAR